MKQIFIPQQRSTTGMKKCYIIVLNYKKWEDSVACLRSVFSSTYTNFTLIIADNNSNNQSIENIIAELSSSPVKKAGSDEIIKFIHLKGIFQLETQPIEFPELVFIQNSHNFGFGAGNNIVLRLLLKEDAYIWLLNPDMIINEFTLEQLIHSSQKNSKAIIGAVTRSFDKPETILFYGGGKINFLSATVSPARRIHQIQNLDYISGGSMFIQTSHLEAVGLLSEDYFLYWEETDWCYNAVKKGFPIEVCLQAVCYDKISTTIGKGFLGDYFYTRNGLLFLAKYKGWYLITALFSVFVRVAIRIFSGKLKRAKGMTKGIIDFLTGARYENK